MSQAVINTIKKQYGEDVVMCAGKQTEAISTGVEQLDTAIGVGGIPRGRITEIFGAESAGKTTLALMIAAQAQKHGEVAFIDIEHALDTRYARMLGAENMLIAQPEDAEQAFSICATLAGSGAYSAIIIDSVAALITRAELCGEMGENFAGSQAKLLGQALSKLLGILSKSKCCLIMTNQLREKVGIMYGRPEVTPGGRALKHYAAVRLDVRKIETIKGADNAIGQRVRVIVAKNKVAPPLRDATFEMYFEGVISNV